MVNRTGSSPMDAVTMVKCRDCGDLVPAETLDAGLHNCKND